MNEKQRASIERGLLLLAKFFFSLRSNENFLAVCRKRMGGLQLPANTRPIRPLSALKARDKNDIALALEAIGVEFYERNRRLPKFADFTKEFGINLEQLIQDHNLFKGSLDNFQTLVLKRHRHRN